jgi:hypothetical protein
MVWKKPPPPSNTVLEQGEVGEGWKPVTEGPEYVDNESAGLSFRIWALTVLGKDPERDEILPEEIRSLFHLKDGERCKGLSTFEKTGASLHLASRIVPVEEEIERMEDEARRATLETFLEKNAGVNAVRFLSEIVDDPNVNVDSRVNAAAHLLRFAPKRRAGRGGVKKGSLQDRLRRLES